MSSSPPSSPSSSSSSSGREHGKGLGVAHKNEMTPSTGDSHVQPGGRERKREGGEKVRK